jgi:hypothetical protein
MAYQLDELKAQVRGRSIDRPGLIKLLRKTRMAAINAGDKATLAQIDGPVEVVADRIIAENRDRTDSEKK